ncbi:MAG: PilZ domain-containing protein [Xanthobacteraceae bacterium]
MEERRKFPRSRVLKSGRIATIDKSRKIDCTVRNVSPAGACVELPSSTFGIPPAFTLLLASGPQPCQVIWRTEQRMGLAFVDRRPYDARNEPAA